MADIAENMPRKPRKKKASDDPRIRELIEKRARLQRTVDGKERFKITAEIRKVITKNTRKQKMEAVKEAFAKHTNWAKIANELRINRPTAPPIFRVEGKSITSDQEAIEAMTKYIEKIYAEPKDPIQIPPWDLNHNVKLGSVREAVGLAVTTIKTGKATDPSGLSNACMRGTKEETVKTIAELIEENKDTPPENGKSRKDYFSTKKGKGKP